MTMIPSQAGKQEVSSMHASSIEKMGRRKNGRFTTQRYGMYTKKSGTAVWRRAFSKYQSAKILAFLHFADCATPGINASFSWIIFHLSTDWQEQLSLHVEGMRGYCVSAKNVNMIVTQAAECDGDGETADHYSVKSHISEEDRHVQLVVFLTKQTFF